MALAPAAYLLYSRIMAHNPSDPAWPDRDRFILSAGHASMLLYSVLHLSGYDLPMSELQRFRQWGSLTPGHPERVPGRCAPGVEATTGPLGQGFANGVGMAMAERFLRERYGSEVMNHRVFAICSDGDLMEGVASEAASLAGHLGLGRLVYLYDDNRITIDGPTSLAFDTEDVEARFRAYAWDVSAVEDANDLPALEAAIDAACREEERPSLIRVRSVIAYPAPSKQGTAGAHGAPLGEDEVRATKERLGFDPDAHFHVSDDVYAAFEPARQRGAQRQGAWEERVAGWRGDHPELAAEWDSAWAGQPLRAIAGVLPRFDLAQKPALATRSASGEVMQSFAAHVPTMIGGAADLAGSTMTAFDDEASFTRERAGRNVHWGVREHAMGAAVNGLALHGGVVKPYGSTYLLFSDYMRPAVRLSALMRLPVVWVFSHDSVALGEDGPTHQPIEHLAALRAIPGLTVIRPCDPAETAEAWRVTLEEVEGPVCLLLSRQKLPVLDRGGFAPAGGLARGAYTLSEPPADPARAVLVASGSEVPVALKAQERLAGDGVPTSVVSIPSWELFAAQARDYQDSVLPPALPKVSLEAGIGLGWSSWVDASVTIERFGASAPGPEVLDRLGVTSARAAAVVREMLDRPLPLAALGPTESVASADGVRQGSVGGRGSRVEAG
jgi:transketolase